MWAGYEDIRDFDGQWIRIEIKKGDLIVLPPGMYHRFTLDTNQYIKVMNPPQVSSEEQTYLLYRIGVRWLLKNWLEIGPSNFYLTLFHGYRLSCCTKNNPAGYNSIRTPRQTPWKSGTTTTTFFYLQSSSCILCISLFISDVQGNLPSLSESCEFGWFHVSLSLQARLRRRCVEERASVASCPAGQSQQQQQAPRLRNKIFGSLEYGVGHEFPRNVEGVRSWIDRQTNRPTVEETPFVQCVPVPPARPPTEYFFKLC